MCTCYMWMSQVVVRVVEPAMERVPEIVMVAIVCQSLNPSQKQVHMRYVSRAYTLGMARNVARAVTRPFRFIFCEKGVARETYLYPTINILFILLLMIFFIY